MHLYVPGVLDAAGGAVPGLPAIVTGRNENCAWGVTALSADVIDLYADTLSADGRQVRWNASAAMCRCSTGVSSSFVWLSPFVDEEKILARTSDQPRQVEENIDLFMHSLYEAVILVVLVSLIGFWEWRSAVLLSLDGNEGYGQVMAYQAMEHGVRGILKRTHPTDTFLKCLRMVAEGGLWFEETLKTSFTSMRTVSLTQNGTRHSTKSSDCALPFAIFAIFCG